MRLHYHPMSGCSRRVLLTAHHLKLPIDLTVVDLFQGTQYSPEFLTLNPNHRVPVLEDEGFILWESQAIMQYLSEKTPSQTLYPLEPRARADVNRWLFWCGTDFSPGISVLNWENFIKGQITREPPSAAEIKRGSGLLREAAKVLDDHMADREWVCGQTLTLADFALAAPLADKERAKLPIDEFGHLQRWFDRVRALDAWRAAIP